MKIISQYICIIILILNSFNGFSQQDPLYTQYYNNFSLINPAYAGSHGYFTATASIRSQWAGEDGAPKTEAISVHGATGKNVGLGLSIVNDKVFVLSEKHIYADFSYALKVSEKSTLAFGIKAGASFLNIDLLELEIFNDPLLNENINQTNPNIGVGAFYYSDKFYVSLSTINLLESTRYEKRNVVTSANKNIVAYLSSGYVFDLSKEFQLRPSFLIRAVNGAPLTTDVSASFLWNNLLEIGISHRFDESISGLFQIRLNEYLKLGYTYDSSTQNIGNYTSGAHELSIIVNLNKSSSKFKKPKVPFNW
ncbi:PorP/SprF family type IX secretion system membrane protein [Lutibacter citreus]|uniref:PorP/SprF family type IX secretion system membrane protein n=1 Tax=Lutibacter citreus TaxID=2138210 RepID=UPI000DBE527B|nr:type IX secretion system membrane protein PorP/SprF [Lutibacter citreus]